MKVLKKSIMVLICLGMFSMVVTGCSSGGGSSSSSPSNTTTSSVSGVAAEGLLSIANITVYALDAAGNQLSPPLGTTTTHADGTYNVPLGPYTGNILILATGGTYTDEATGASTINTVPLHAVVTGVSGNVSAAVTPLTEIAFKKAGQLSTANINYANAIVSNMIGGVDIITTMPADVLVSSASTTAEKNYGLALAAISEMVQLKTATSESDAISQISADLADNKLDSTGANISAALTTFITSGSNMTGLTTSTASVIQGISNATSTTIIPVLSTGSASLLGSWLLTSPIPSPDHLMVLTFIDDTTFINGETGLHPHPDSYPGMEYSIYSATSASFYTTNIVDTDGWWGTNQTGNLSFVSYPIGYSISGNVLTFLDNSNAQLANFAKIQESSTNPLVGSWKLVTMTSGSTGSVGILTFIDDTNFMYVQYNASNSSQNGVESGTYTKTSTSFSLSIIWDTLGGAGMASLIEPVPYSISGTTLVIGTSTAGATFTKQTPTNSLLISGFTGTAGLTVTARHPSDIDNSSPIAQTVSTGTDGAFSLYVPYGSDLYLNISGTVGTTPYASMNSRIFRNITSSPVVSNSTGGDLSQADADSIFNNSICGSTPCSTTGTAGKGWLLLDTDTSPPGTNHIGGVSFALSSTPVFFGYNNDSPNGNILLPPPSLTATVTGTVNFQISSAGGYFTSATIVTVTASKTGSPNQTYEFPIVPGEISYMDVLF